MLSPLHQLETRKGVINIVYVYRQIPGSSNVCRMLHFASWCLEFPGVLFVVMKALPSAMSMFRTFVVLGLNISRDYLRNKIISHVTDTVNSYSYIHTYIHACVNLYTNTYARPSTHTNK